MPKRLTDGNFALGLVVGICLCLIFGLWFSLFSQRIEQPVGTDHDGHGHAYAENYEQENEVGWWRWTGSLVTSSDTLAQWIMMAFTVGAVFLVWRTLIATQDMARDTRELGIAQSSPIFSLQANETGDWLSLMDVPGERYFPSSTFIASNKGLGGATDFAISGHLIGKTNDGEELFSVRLQPTAKILENSLPAASSREIILAPPAAIRVDRQAMLNLQRGSGRLELTISYSYDGPFGKGKRSKFELLCDYFVVQESGAIKPQWQNCSGEKNN